jgi:hypothetical protein
MLEAPNAHVPVHDDSVLRILSSSVDDVILDGNETSRLLAFHDFSAVTMFDKGQ